MSLIHSTMETDILTHILDNQGAVVTEDLLFNLCDTASLTEILCKNDKFVTCLISGTPKVVVRTSVALCWRKDCPGCGSLHLCKGFFLTGSCQFSSTRRRCFFSHDLHSDYNEKILRESGLETLTRTQLCALLLQSNNNLLPPICYNYNNRKGCQDGCPRLHICERFLQQDCSCFRTHDFQAPQPLKLLRDRRIPESLITSLKSIYANKEALRLGNKQDSRRKRGEGCLIDHKAVSCVDLSSNDEGGEGTLKGTFDTVFSGNDKTQANRGKTCSSQDISFSDIAGSSMSFLNSDYFQHPDMSELLIHDFESHNTLHMKSSKGCGKERKTEAKGREGKGNTDNKVSQNDLLSSFKQEEKLYNNKRQNHMKKDKTEICMYFIKGHCKHEDRCFKAHDKMPYRWQFKQDGQWTNMPSNEKIEQAYCDPGKTYSTTDPPVSFDTMKCEEKEVRRLSTTNSVQEPNFIHTTDWLWYWEDDQGKWQLYGAQAKSHGLTNVTSKQLEELCLKKEKDVIQFKAGSQSYELSFQDMIQTNINYGTKRIVRRRPQFVSAVEVQTKRKRPANTTTFPDYWDKAQISPTEHKCISLPPTLGEYREIHDLFCQTMKGFDILKIERIQNKAVWEAFQLHKEHLKNKNNGQPVAEKKLFHGTDPSYVNTICAMNFDWRVCGLNGTVYGQGSYFARDARYSHSYTGSSDVRYMFVSRVLVGEYAKGRSEYRRPPSKDGGDVNLYDSCVDDVVNPSIFVVFEKQQIYPEYVLQYRPSHQPTSYQQQPTSTTATVKPYPNAVTQSSASALSKNVSTNPITTLPSAASNILYTNQIISSLNSSNNPASNLATKSIPNAPVTNPTPAFPRSSTSMRSSTPTSIKPTTPTSMTSSFRANQSTTSSVQSPNTYGNYSALDSSFTFLEREAFRPSTPRKSTKQNTCVIA